MSDLHWYEGYPPRDVDVEKVTALLRVLASRPRVGLLRRTPIAVFELWVQGGTIRWVIGIDEHLVPTLPSQLRAHLPGLTLVELKRGELNRPKLKLAADVRLRGLSFPLRLDTHAGITDGLVSAARGVGKQEWAVVQWVIGPSHPRREVPSKFSVRSALGFEEPPTPDATEQHAWREKISEPLFAVRGRIGAGGRQVSNERASRIVRSHFAPLTLASAPYAELKLGSTSESCAHDLRDVYATGASWSLIANAGELAALMPLGAVASGASGLVLHPAPKQLRLPLDDLAKHSGERIIGVGLHPADQGQAVRIPAASCLQHLALVAPTGAGKSTALARFCLADIHAGRSVFLLEPRGDLVEDVLAHFPAERRDELVVVEPASTWVIGLNPLAGPVSDADRRADEVFAVFRDEFGSGLGPRSSHILLNALISVARLGDGTLTDVMLLLKNSSFRRGVVTKVNDPLVLAPFWAEYNLLTSEQQLQHCAPLSNKIGAFLSREPIRRMLGQPAPSFSLADLFTPNRRRVVLVNLNRGLLGSETCRLLGRIVLSHLWMEIQRRAAVPREQRHTVTCIIDEFQDFVGALDFGEVLAQARGLGVSVTTANQHAAQLDEKLQKALTANSRSRIAWRPSQDDVTALAKLFGGGIAPADLEQLKAHEACARLIVNNTMTAPFTVKTLPLPKASAAAKANATALRLCSQQRYGVEGHEVDRRLIERAQGDKSPDAPIGSRRRRVS